MCNLAKRTSSFRHTAFRVPKLSYYLCLTHGVTVRFFHLNNNRQYNWHDQKLGKSVKMPKYFLIIPINKGFLGQYL